MTGRVYWASRHELSPAQLQAIKDLHGEDVEIAKEEVIFSGIQGLVSFLIDHQDGFAYVVVPAHIAVYTALAGYSFGLFENHSLKRQDGQFGLAAVYHIQKKRIVKVWENPDPIRDVGEALIPVAKRL